MISPHVHVPYDSLNDYLPFVKEEGLNLEIYFGSGGFDGLTKDDIIRLKHVLDYNPGLSIHAPFMDLSPGAVDLKIRDVTMKRFLTVLDFAEILAPRVIVFHSGYDKWKYDKRVDIWLEKSLETWRPLNQRAAGMGIRIAIENIFEDEPENLLLLTKGMNSENFGLCFDTGHFNLFSKLPLLTWIEMIKPYIVELHLHDNSRYADHHLPIGDGDFDFPSLFRELEGVDCVYTLEAHTIEDVKKSMERLKGLLQK
ncbi:MAG: sugar phosphate isomerase/epimerase [Nitrospiraceae bacterium]|nr:MAG: sugar phosphate isomerase/epimerase [Nitrospiraceae bacterium]